MVAPFPRLYLSMLKDMVEEGLLSRPEDKKYSLTSKGREEIDRPFGRRKMNLASAPRSVEGMLEELSSFVSYLEDVAQSKDGRLRTSAGQIKELAERMQKVSENS